MSLRRWVVGWIAAFVLVAACDGGDDPVGDVTSPPGPATTAIASSTTAIAPSTATVPTTTTVPAAAAKATVTGPEEMVYDWTFDQCEPETLPDLPALAFRSADGTVNLILSSRTNYRMVGADFDSLQVDCDPLRLSTMDVDPSQYRFQEWIGSLYTEDGETIYAIIHNEFHGERASFALANRDFGDAQGEGGWTYLGSGTSGEFPLEFADGQWRAGDSLCLVGAWGLHPDIGCDAIRRWTVPTDGQIAIYVAANDTGIGGGDGVDIGVRHNGDDLWTAAIEEGDTEGVTVELDRIVVAGDQLDFWVTAREDALYDSTGLHVEINYGQRPCPSGDMWKCQMMALTYSLSTDGGASFTSPESSEHLIAAVPYRYEPNWGLAGLWQPTNIVRNPTDGHYYLLVQRDIHFGSRNLTTECLLRTDTLDDPSSWRAYDGEGFNHVFVNPYTDSGEELCWPIMDAPVWSISYNTYLERFVALQEIPSLLPPGVYFRTSEDLIEWSDPELIIEWKIGFANDFEPPFEAYPSLIDPDSPSLSFETTGQTSHLYFTRINGYDPLDFDLLRVPIRFEK